MKTRAMAMMIECNNENEVDVWLNVIWSFVQRERLFDG